MKIVDFTGTVSEATMRPQDLLPKFLSVLEAYHPEAYAKIEAEFGAKLDNIDADDEWWESEECSWLLDEDVWEAMNDIAPEGYYFGAHPGDGADYGFWEAEGDW